MSGELCGKLAIVTGAGSGIGRAVALLFAQKGATVDIVDINQNGMQETLALLPKGEYMTYGINTQSLKDLGFFIVFSLF